MDEEYRQQLTEQLQALRRLQHRDEMTRASYGMNADTSLIIRIEDREKEIRAIEARLGITWPQPAPRPRYETPPEPEPVFHQRMVSQQQQARQRDIEHQLTLLQAHRHNLAHYRGQAQLFGGTRMAPPYVGYGIQEAVEKIAKCKEALRSYGEEVTDLAGDE